MAAIADRVRGCACRPSARCSGPRAGRRWCGGRSPPSRRPTTAPPTSQRRAAAERAGSARPASAAARDGARLAKVSFVVMRVPVRPSIAGPPRRTGSAAPAACISSTRARVRAAPRSARRSRPARRAGSAGAAGEHDHAHVLGVRRLAPPHQRRRVRRVHQQQHVAGLTPRACTCLASTDGSSSAVANGGRYARVGAQRQRRQAGPFALEAADERAATYRRQRRDAPLPHTIILPPAVMQPSSACAASAIGRDSVSAALVLQVRALEELLLNALLKHGHGSYDSGLCRGQAPVDRAGVSRRRRRPQPLQLVAVDRHHVEAARRQRGQRSR